MHRPFLSDDLVQPGAADQQCGAVQRFLVEGFVISYLLLPAASRSDDDGRTRTVCDRGCIADRMVLEIESVSRPGMLSRDRRSTKSFDN